VVQNAFQKFSIFLFAPHLQDGEKIFLVIHRHPFIILKEGLGILFLAVIIPTFLWYLFAEVWVIFLVWMLIGATRLGMIIFNWYLDVILITSVSLIDVKWNGPFDRTSMRLEYNMIEGTSYSIRGIIPTIFNYGTLRVEGAGGATVIQLLHSMNPAEIEKKILERQEQFTGEQNFRDAKTLKNLLSNMLSQHAKKVNPLDIDS